MRPGAQREKGEQSPGRSRKRELLTVAFRGHSPQQPYLQHVLTLYSAPSGGYGFG
jgi:hypothetical protein